MQLWLFLLQASHTWIWLLCPIHPGGFSQEESDWMRIIWNQSSSGLTTDFLRGLCLGCGTFEQWLLGSNCHIWTLVNIKKKNIYIKKHLPKTIGMFFISNVKKKICLLCHYALLNTQQIKCNKLTAQTGINLTEPPVYIHLYLPTNSN